MTAMADWQTDDDYLSGAAATSLPTPQDTPYRTPSRGSKVSRRSGTPSARGESPPSLQSEKKDKASKRQSRDITMDETISILDPRRFTPTLHANLVSEILALRRDQDEKLRVIESLESILSSSKEENESNEERFVAASKENRSLKRQLALLEGGTSSALGELARERDEAVESAADAKKRLETAAKKIRTQENDSERVHELWAQEKDAWQDERRKFERKVHVAESRLKTVLDEVAAFQNAQNEVIQEHDSDVESGKENDAASVRSMSMTNSIRFSLRGPNGKLNGNSLADELNFDDDDDEEQTDVEGRESVLSHRTTNYHSRNMSRDSIRSKVHRRNQSLESLRRTGSIARSKLYMNQSVLEALEGVESEKTEADMPVVSYVDTGIQYSPPPSPKISPVRPATPEPSPQKSKMMDSEVSPGGNNEIEANQRRKRVQITPPLMVEPPVIKIPMVSSASQTMEEPLSPPRTPKTARPETPPQEVEQEPPLIMVTSSTQTEDLPPPSPRQTIPPPPLIPPPPIPSINIQPPTSRPTTPLSPRLPPHFKHFGCQVNILHEATTSEAGVQTEGIKVDQRLAQLPPHLQPSSITSRPTSPVATSPVDLDAGFTPVPGNVPPRNPRRLVDRGAGAQTPSSPIASVDEYQLHDAYPGNNDDGPLSSETSAPIKRPHRFSSLFAGFDTASSDEGEFDKDDMSDSEFPTALSAPRPQSTSTRGGAFSPPSTAPPSPDRMTRRRSVRNSVKPFGTEVYSSFSLEKEDSSVRSGTGSGSAKFHERSSGSISRGPGNRASVMRKAAMIQSGIASHSGRARSPSLPETKNPPFPIPKRASSRKPNPLGGPTSDGQRSPTSHRGVGRIVTRNNSLRKVRSATVIGRNQRQRRHGSRSPPPLSPSTEAPESPSLPPLPQNDITTPRPRQRVSSQYRRHAHKPSTNTEQTTNTEPASIESSSQTTGVVDAIAQTMVGEWMLKYVRRRKSFSVAENNNKDDTGNDRHKRWVWLAPYERAILWSSKQPSSGSALMGKTGRKLIIQSVLDVKDDNPPPKGMGTVFNRSILILTPQRALKFTATSPDRHYVWLTALSFLAHSSQALPDIISAPAPSIKPQPQPLPEIEPPSRFKKRGGIRDSIRLAKGKPTPSLKANTPSVPSIPSAQSSQLGDGASFHIADMVGVVSSSHTREDSQDAAEPPMIPRFNDRNGPPAVHGRKRSNTGGHIPPPLSFRGFSGPAVGSVSSHNPTNSTAGASIGTEGSSDIFQSQGSGHFGWGLSQTASHRTSEASSQRANFFDAVGTVRMEAFISPLAHANDFPDERSEASQAMRRRSKDMRRRRSRSRTRFRDSYGQNSSHRGSEDRYGSHRDDESYREDPFRGF